MHDKNATILPSRYTPAHKLLEGDALLAAFEKATATTQGSETIDNVGVVVTAVMKHIFLAHALQTQKRFMQSFLQKH